MAQNLVRLWHLTGNDAYRRDVDDILAASASAVAGNLFATTGMLNALDLRINAVDVVVVRPAGVSADALLDAIRWRWSPNIVLSLFAGRAELPATNPAAGKTAIKGKATAYVCRGEICSLPVTEAGEFRGLL